MVYSHDNEGEGKTLPLLLVLQFEKKPGEKIEKKPYVCPSLP